MSISSINFKPIKENSQTHNERVSDLDYVYSDLTKNNESWKAEEVGERLKKIQSYCKEVTGRKMQKNTEPIREAVVNLEPHHDMKDLKRLASVLKASHGIECFQIHIHRDEGKSRRELNYHAHMVFDWVERDPNAIVIQQRKIKNAPCAGMFENVQVKGQGKTKKLNKADLSQIQTLVAKTLGMERGELKENSNRQRLEPIEYKRKQEEKRVAELQSKVKDLEQKEKRVAELQSTVKDLEQKKNNLVGRHRKYLEEFRAAEEEHGSLEEFSKARKAYLVLESRIEEREGKSYQDFLEERKRQRRTN